VKKIVKKIGMASMLLIIPNAILAADNINKAVNELCECVAEPNKKLAKLNADMDKAELSGKDSIVLKLLELMPVETKKVDACFEISVKNYSELHKDNKLKKQFDKAVNKKCPSPETFGTTEVN
jgi:hypothetical protein